MWYLDPLTVIVLVVFAVYGAERVFVDVVRFVDRRTRRKPKTPPPPSTIIIP